MRGRTFLERAHTKRIFLLKITFYLVIYRKKFAGPPQVTHYLIIDRKKSPAHLKKEPGANLLNENPGPMPFLGII